MAKAEQTIVLTPTEALRLREQVASIASRALSVLDAELGALAEAGATVAYDEDGNPLSKLTDWAKTFKIVADQVRRDNPTEHLVERTGAGGEDNQPEEEKPKPSLKGLKLRVTG
jgi:hypothetical protein